MSAPHNPRVTQADADVAQAIVSGVRGYGVTFASPLEHSASVMVARHREAAEAASKARTMSDHGRMLWRDDVEGHCRYSGYCTVTVDCDGEIVGANSYGLHYFENKVPMAKVDGLDEIALVMRSL